MTLAKLREQHEKGATIVLVTRADYSDGFAIYVILGFYFREPGELRLHRYLWRDDATEFEFKCLGIELLREDDDDTSSAYCNLLHYMTYLYRGLIPHDFPEPSPHLCQCGAAKKREDRYCRECTKRVKAEMKNSGYLMPVPPAGSGRHKEQQEVVWETKYGVDD